MPVYAIAQLSIHDRDRYERYVRRFFATLDGFAGRLLAADEAVAVVEGDWPHDKVVLLEFDSRHEFERWSTSADYAAIAADRRAATQGPVIVVKGLGSSEPE